MMQGVDEAMHGGYLCVPKDDVGIRSLDFNIDDDEHVMQWCLTAEESDSLSKVFTNINSKLGIALDYCEDEVIPKRGIEVALGVVQRERDSSDSPAFKSAIEKLSTSLLFACEFDTYVWVFL